MIKKLCLTLTYIFSFAISHGQNAQLAQNFASGNFEECIKQSDAVLKKEANNSQAHFFKGASLIRLEHYKKAEKHLKMALENKYQPAVAVNANLLRAYAGQKQTDVLLEKLQNMTKLGFSGLGFLGSKEFTYLVGNQKFKDIKVLIDKNANPCKYGKEYKKIDFWIGEWDVYAGNSKIADSKIVKSDGGCTLHEDYKTVRGFLGRSMSYYDPADSLYKQTWVDKFNTVINFKEIEARDEYFQMQADSGDGNLTRMSYEYNKKDDTVTQTMESSSDNGKSWSTSFLGVYKRKV